MKEIKKYLSEILSRFSEIGSNGDGKGYTRLGYSDVEDQMHKCFLDYAKEYGLNTYTDKVGNSYVYIKEHEKYDYIGSHLDSVIEGGQFDGPLGVAVGLSILIYIKENNLDIPLKVIAFRNEESTNFLYATIGSKLITGKLDLETFNRLKSLNGEKLSDIFKEKSLNPNTEIISDIKSFMEIHIEQARVLESENKNIGIITTIAGSCRLIVTINGVAEHSGATPMDFRHDALCAASEIILKVEEIGNNETETSVGTVGYIKNSPNSLNVIPGKTTFSIDFRDIYVDSMERMREKAKSVVAEVAKRRGLEYEIEEFKITPSVELYKKGIEDLENIAKEENISYKIMHSGPSHDAMMLTDICNTNMLFIPCENGISHNPNENIDIDDAVVGADLILKYLDKINRKN